MSVAALIRGANTPYSIILGLGHYQLIVIAILI